ncbi:MAG TPA: MaoC family dehydratase N-terminal domain-containing protein [Burkholderiaceae bacterium]|nr:MaoC family dehydratase N-terminal domain-containing protein [Burkholderiaceae bacterium]
MSAATGLDAFDASAWVGREERATVRAVRETVELLEASLDRPAPGAGLEPLRHWLWLFAPPAPPTATLGPDGHPPRGTLVPDWPLPRRMWAGSTVDFLEPVPLDATLERHTRLESASVKTGRSGTLGFVVLRHRWLLDGRCAIDDAQTIVYREPAPPGGPAAPAQAAAPAAAPSPAWEAAHRPDEALLFRYSAVTFNTHRIHYDAPYVTGVEGYPGLVVHGPLMATMMLDAFRDAHPGARVRRFSFRALAPAFAGETLHAGGAPAGDGRAALWLRGADGRERLAGEATFD